MPGKDTGRVFIYGRGYVTEEQAREIEQGGLRPLPPEEEREQPGLTERLGDAAHTAVSTALDIAHRIQAVTFGQEALSRRPIEQFTGWDAPDIMELGTRINLGMTPLAWPQEARSIPMEYPGLMVRPFAAAISPTLEALRRYRMGEEQETLGWYAQQAARELFRGPQNEGPVSKVLAPFGDWTPGGALLRQFAPELREAPETDRFRAGYELVTGQREGAARGWAGAAGLVAGEAGELLPMLPLLLISRGPATTRGMQRVGAQAATRTGSYLFETARSAANSGADVATVQGLVKASREAPGVLRSLSDRWFGQRRTLAGNIRESMREGGGTALDRLMKDFVEGEARLTREAEAALVGRGVSETAAKAAARSFASEVIWGAEEGWRLAGVRLGRRPGETVVSRLRRRAVTTTGRDPAGLRTIVELERPAETFPLSQLIEPVRSRVVQNAEFYLRQRSSRASATSEAAASSVLDTMNAGAEAAAKVRAEAVMRERLSGAVRRLRMNEEARATVEGQAPVAEAPAPQAPAPAEATLLRPMAPPWEPSARDAMEAEPSVVGSRGVEAPVEAPEVAPAAPQAAPEVAGGGEVPETAPEAPAASEARIGGMTRAQADALDAEASTLQSQAYDLWQQIDSEIADLKPIGNASDWTAGSKGVIVETAGGGYRFAKARQPKPAQLARWEELAAEARRLSEEARSASEAAAEFYKQPPAPSEQPQEVVSSPQNVVEPAALPAPGERVVMREARTGREEVGQVVADPETGQPLLATASDGTPVASFEREDGSTTWVPWVADPAIVSFEQAPQTMPGVEAWIQLLDEMGNVRATREGAQTGFSDKMKLPSRELLPPDKALAMLRALMAEGALENKWGDVTFVSGVRDQLRRVAQDKGLPQGAYVLGALAQLVERAADTVSHAEREVFGGGPDWLHQWQWSLLDAEQDAPLPEAPPSAREQLGIPDAPPVLADDAARAAVSRNIRTLNAALDHVLPQLARMVETHDPASASAISATQAIRLATTARNDAQAQADAPTDALEEIVAEISDARDARDRSDAEDAVAEVLSVAQVLSEQLQAALVEQGVLEAEAQAAGRRASAGYLLLHEATLREAQRWPDAMEGLASLQEGMTPQTLDDLQAREALKQAALREALLTLGEEPAMPELERFALEAPGPEATSREQAHAMLDEGEVLPGEPPIITVARSAVEQVGGEFTPELADIARQAELQRLEVEATRLQREIETYTEGYAAYDDALQQQFELELAQNMEDQRRSRAEADAKQDVEQLQEAARTLKPYLLKYPDVRTELKPTLSVLETETLGMLTAIHHRLLGIYERPRGERALSTEERWLLSYLGAAQQVNASPRDQLRIVLGEAVAEAVIQQGAIRPDGTLDYDKLPRTERRIFEAAAERREFYDDIAHGRKGLPSFQQLSERLYDYRRYGEDVGEPPARPEPIENYLPQFTIHAQGPEDLEWLRDVFTLEWMRGRQEPAVRNRYEALGLLENESQGLREPRREDIVRKRVYPTITAKRAHMQEIATELGVDPGVVEVDPLIQDTVYLHQFGALRTAVGVYEWIHEYGDEQMDVEMDPALGPEVAQAMLDRGWGPPRPFGLALPGTANFLLPPPVQGALNGIIARGTLTPIFDQVITRKIMPPIRKALWSLSMLPLQTLTFLGTQFVELFANVAASGAANPARPKALLEGYALANRVLARQIMGIAETCHPTTWAAEMKLVHARMQENLWAALMKRYELTPDDIQILQDGLKRHNIVEGSVGAQAHEHLERMLSALNLHAKEIQAISHGIMSMVFGIDTFARTWSICSLVAQGYTMDEAGKMTRESSANYDLKTPIYTVASSWAFYSTWLMQRAEQAASLTYKRPGVLYLFAELDDDKERFLGFSAGWQPLVEAGLWWGIDDPTVMPIKRSHPLVGEIEGFLAGTEVLEEWDGYQLFYAPLRLPLLDIMGTGRALSNRPLATLMEMAVPAVRGLAAAETGRGKASSLMREMPGVGPWVRAADRFPEEVLPRLTASVGPAQRALADPPEEFWASVVDAGETPRAAQAKPARWKKVQRQLDMGVPRSQTEPGRYEVEKMQFLYLLEKAKRRTGVPLYAGGVPDAVNLLTPEGIERVIEAIDAGEWIASKPSETPQQFRKRLEEELAQRRPEEAGKAPVGPMTPDEQRGGIAATVSRMLRPVTMEGVAP